MSNLENRLKKIIRNSIIKEIANSNRFTIDEIFEREINGYICEAYGVSNDVEKECDIIKQMIYNTLDSSRKHRYSMDLTLCSNIINFKWLGKDINLEYNVYVFSNDRVYKEYNKNCFGCYTNPNRGYISLNIAFINNRFISETDEAIQHELTHLYEFIRRGNGTLMKVKYEKLYKKVTNKMNEILKGNGTKFEYSILYALYASFKCEQNAFFNGLDSQLKNHSIDWKNIVYKSKVYYNLNKIREMISRIDEYKDMLSDLIGISENTYISILKRAEKRILRGIGRVVMKNEKEDINNGMMYNNKL